MDNIMASICYRPTDDKNVVRPQKTGGSPVFTFPGPHGTTLIPARGPTQQVTSSPEVFWSALMSVFWDSWSRKQLGKGACSGPCAFTQGRTGSWCGDMGHLWLQWLLDGGIQVKILRGGSKTKNHDHKFGLWESRLLPFQILAWKNPMGIWREEELRNTGWIMLKLPCSLL